MTEILTVKKIRNKVRAIKIKKYKKDEYGKRFDVMTVPIPFDVFLEKIQGIPKEQVKICLNNINKNIIMQVK